METGPPRLIEALVGLLIPPVSREHVLGDLRERYPSTRQYIVGAIQVAPFVIGSQVYRSADGLRVGLQAFVLWMVLRPDTLWSIYGVAAILRLALPIGAMLIAFALTEAYLVHPSPADDDLELAFDVALRNAIVAGAVGACALMMAEAALKMLSLGPAWILPRRILIKGMIGGALMILPVNVAWEMLFRSSGGGFLPKTSAASTSLLRSKAEQLHRSRCGMIVWPWLILQSAAIGWWLSRLQAQPVFLRWLGAVILAAAGYAGWRMSRELTAHRALRTATTIESYRTALAGRSVVFRRSWPWFVGPFVLARLALALQLGVNHPQWWWPPAVETASSVAMAWLLYTIGTRLTRVLQREVDALSALEAPPIEPPRAR